MFTFLGIIFAVFVGFVVLMTVVAVVAAFIVWRLVAPEAQKFRLDLSNRGVRAFTERGEIIPGTVIYKTKAHESRLLDAPSTSYEIGSDGEIVDSPFYDDDNDRQSRS